MEMPKHSDMYGLVLDVLKDKKIHTIKEIKRKVIQVLKLSKEDLLQMLPSGKQNLFDNRIGWCRTFLKKAMLIESPQKGHFVITDRGLKLLAQEPVITTETLMRFPEFVEFVRKDDGRGKVKPVRMRKNRYDSTPQENLEQAYKELNEELANDLLALVVEMDPYRFEAMLVELLIKMGYGKLQYSSGVTKKSRDEGIDGIVTADKLGFDSIYIQAKRYKDGVIGRADIQKFVGALAGQGAQKGIFITTSKFTQDAEKFVDKNFNYKVVLIDGKSLSDLMIEYELGVSTEYIYKLKKVDSDYFSEQ